MMYCPQKGKCGREMEFGCDGCPIPADCGGTVRCGNPVSSPAGPVERRPGMKLVRRFRSSEPVVSMLEYRGEVLVATSRRIFKINENMQLEPIRMYEKEENIEA